MRGLISLHEYRTTFDFATAVQRLIREGYLEGCVHRAIARVRLGGAPMMPTAEVLVRARRELARMRDAKLPR